MNYICIFSSVLVGCYEECDMMHAVRNINSLSSSVLGSECRLLTGMFNLVKW
jgi:hypothetical protein